MNCHAARALLDLYAEDRLVAGQSRRVAAHLKICSNCARALELLRPARAPAVAMPAALKEKLRAALTAASADLPPLSLPPDPAPRSGPSVARDALVGLAALLPFAALAGASAVEAATVLGALAAAGALTLAGLRRGRWTFSAVEGAWAAAGLAAAAWPLARGVLGPAFGLPAALARAALPALFLTAGIALGGHEEAERLKRAVLWTFWAFVAGAVLGAPPPHEALAALGCVALGCAVGLRALGAAPRKVWALPVALPPGARRGFSVALAAGWAAVALIPAAWLADDYKLSSAEGLASLAEGRDEALRRLDSIGRFSPAWPAARLAAADLTLAGDDPAGALRRLAAVAAAAPDYPGVAYREGVAYGKLGVWKMSLACHQRARAENPLFVPNLEGLATAAKSVGDFTLARETALTVIALDPKDPLHGMELADIAAREKKARERKGDRHVRRPRNRKRRNL